jgi:hypothetical protein
MFVALKYIFASDTLDEILLREYASLPDQLAQIYRHVAAIHAMGIGASRQLVIRGLNLMADEIATILSHVEDVIEEREVGSAEGIYEWTTRHEVVAQTLVRYKYFNEDEWFNVLRSLVTDCNPTIYFEQRMLRQLCNSPFGVRRLILPGHRVDLYETILRTMPSERVAWHRLIHEYLARADTGAAESAIRSAEENVGIDPPLQRYKVLLLVGRAEASPGLVDADRRALLRMARHEALQGLGRFPDNWYSFGVLEVVAAAWQNLTGSQEMAQEFMPLLRDACDRLLEPQLEVIRRRMESGLPVKSVEEALADISLLQ